MSVRRDAVAGRICLLTPQALDADPFPEDDWPCDPRPFLPQASWELAVLEKATAVGRVIALSRQRFDVFFNLCDGAWDQDTPGIEVVQALERLGVPFTGATSEFYEPTRDAMKRVCWAWGIDTPSYVMATDETDVHRAADTLRFPLIVKHPSSYASIGLTRESRVESPAALLERAHRMLEAYAGALIEEYIDGTECTVLVAENPEDPYVPITYTPMQYAFPEGESFKHADMKWVEYDGMTCTPVRQDHLAEELQRICAGFFLGLNGAGFGRCDLRVDAEGRAYMLEINPNCGVYYPPDDAGSADLCLLHDPAGHAGFTRQLVRAALRRHDRRARGWVVRARADGGFGVYVARPYAAGEPILAFEEQPHELVTRSRMERDWPEWRRDRAWRDAWPLTEELWVLPGRDPEAWKPVGHSCDPSAWFEGLDVVARRALAEGEEVTLDYATYRNELMSSFECSCGAAGCRGTIRGDDCLQEFVGRYGDHVSDYVRRRRASGSGTDGAQRSP